MTAPSREVCATLIIPAKGDPPAATIHAWIRTALATVPAPNRQLAALLAHELIASVLDNGQPPYVLRLTALHRTLVVSIDDATIATERAWHDPGLVLASGLSTRWGVEQRRLARTIWAEIAMDAQPLQAPDQPRPTSTPGPERRRGRQERRS